MTGELLLQAFIAITAVAGLLKSYNNSKKIEEVHLVVNSRMDELLRLTKVSSEAVGNLQGRIDEKATHDKG